MNGICKTLIKSCHLDLQTNEISQPNGGPGESSVLNYSKSSKSSKIKTQINMRFSWLGKWSKNWSLNLKRPFVWTVLRSSRSIGLPYDQAVIRLRSLKTDRTQLSRLSSDQSFLLSYDCSEISISQAVRRWWQKGPSLTRNVCELKL